MKENNGAEQREGDLAAEGRTFDWETLPDLAKDRWEEAVAYDLTVETQLANAQSNRSHAEVERQRVAGEILEATREVCHEIASDARKALESARYMEIDAAQKHGRKGAVAGRSMVDNVAMATKMGYLKAPDGLLSHLNDMKNLRPEEVVLVTTGSQGEPTSALARIANKQHPDIKVLPGDTIVVSATPSQGSCTGTATVTSGCEKG